MNEYFTDAHLAHRRRVRDFALERIVPVAGAFDKRSEFPWENVRAMGEMGFLGVPVPKEYGGMGLDYTSYILTVHELAKYCASHSITVSAHTTLGSGPILSFGDEDQKRTYLPCLAAGDVLGGFGLTEPGAGSDAGGTRTRAVRQDDGSYLINGAKIFITHSGVGEVFTVTAVTEPEAGARGITSFIVTKPTVDPEAQARVGMGTGGALEYLDGVQAGKKEDKMGWRASDTRELLLENVRVPDANRLGEEGQGFVNFMKTLDAGRIGIAGLSLGLAEGAYESALRYAAVTKDAGAGGKGRLWDRQQTHFKLAEIATEIQAGYHLTYHAARLKDRGAPFSKEAAMAKLFCSELAMRATLEAIQLMGPDGYTDAYPVERLARDAKVCEIGEGTSEVQKMVIGRHILQELQDADRSAGIPEPSGV
ncbi:MAG: acyl-CoA dehydrogenase family protein [Longimicrobiales bacterium]|nr:acyl-CoA dehydrogenase family protein [Longimicrobiales bacterium]